MLTITLPEWMLWIINFTCALYIIQNGLRLYIWHLRRKIERAENEVTK